MNFGGYTVIRLLGKGGMSEVYEVENSSGGSHYALKLFTYAKEGDSARARFEAEGRLLAKLDHPRIVKVHSIGLDEATNRPYFVMDLILDGEGKVRSLGEVSDGEADEDTIGRWYDDIREGLAYIHGKGIIHRDLKLQNVLVGADGHVVITDFGISKVFAPEAGGHTLIDPVQTIIRLKSGEKPLMGSVGYMAPELEMGLPASPQSDWYALGVIVYKLLTGVWCDARTDVVAMLATYQPAWGRIIPKLLHSNPQGRECLSFAEETARDREAREFELEEKWLNEKSRGHRARHVARYVGALAILLVAGLAVVGYQFSSQLRSGRMRQSLIASQSQFPGFEDLFKIPAEAKAEEQSDKQGNVVMCSRAQFEAARVDALILTHRLLTGLHDGNISLEMVIREFERFHEQLDESSDISPFDRLHFGENDYIQFGESEPLRMLFARAIEKLEAAAEK